MRVGASQESRAGLRRGGAVRWSQVRWDSSVDSPVVDRQWSELTDAEQGAARVLGFAPPEEAVVDTHPCAVALVCPAEPS